MPLDYRQGEYWNMIGYYIRSSNLFLVDPLFCSIHLLFFYRSLPLRSYKTSKITIYRIAQILTGGNFDIFDTFQLDRQNLTHHKQYSVDRCMVKDSADACNNEITV